MDTVTVRYGTDFRRGHLLILSNAMLLRRVSGLVY